MVVASRLWWLRGGGDEVVAAVGWRGCEGGSTVVRWWRDGDDEGGVDAAGGGGGSGGRNPAGIRPERPGLAEIHTPFFMKLHSKLEVLVGNYKILFYNLRFRYAFSLN
ncbi:hypothetical protein Tco_1477299 [Tanacetum coccineum]